MPTSCVSLNEPVPLSRPQFSSSIVLIWELEYLLPSSLGAEILRRKVLGTSKVPEKLFVTNVNIIIVFVFFLISFLKMPIS